MKIGKWYIIIGTLCIGFGTPPEEYLSMIDRDRAHAGNLPEEDLTE